MKSTLLTLASLLCVLASASAQNLLVNGDLETGAAAPWTGGTIAADPAGGFNLTSTASISQTVATTAGKRYFFSADVLVAGGFPGVNASMSATPSGGITPDGTRTVGSAISTGVVRGSLLFTATSASTVVSFAVFQFPGPVSSLTIDNAILVEVEPSKLTGRYAGTNLTTVSLTNAELTNKTTRKVTARITEENLIYIIDGTQAIFSGVILNDGTFDVSSPLALRAAGSGKVRGKRIELEFNGPTVTAFETTGTPIPHTVKNRIVLNRK